MVENTVERETQPGRRRREVMMEERATEMQRLIAAARGIVGGNDEDAAELISLSAAHVREMQKPSGYMSELDLLVRDARRAMFGT